MIPADFKAAAEKLLDEVDSSDLTDIEYLDVMQEIAFLAQTRIEAKEEEMKEGN